MPSGRCKLSTENKTSNARTLSCPLLNEMHTKPSQVLDYNHSLSS